MARSLMRTLAACFSVRSFRRFLSDLSLSSGFFFCFFTPASIHAACRRARSLSRSRSSTNSEWASSAWRRAVARASR
jgi:hypothetical protein